MIVFRYFLAEGVMCQHGLFLVSTSRHPIEIIQNLPKPVSSATFKGELANSEDMKIAFMYKNMPQHSTALSEVSKFGHYYDISSVMDASMLEKCETKVLKINSPTADCPENLFK